MSGEREPRSAVDRLTGASVAPIWVRVVVAVLVVAVVVLALAWRHAGADGRAEQAALGVAKQRVQQLTTYRYDSFDDDVSWAKRGATATFRREYTQANRPIRTAAKRLKASATGHVTDAAATAHGDDRVRVLLFVEQTLTRSGERQRVEDSRVVVEMVHRDGRWLVDDVRVS